MKQSKLVIIGFVVLAVLVVGGLLAVGRSDKKSTTSSSAASSSSSSASSSNENQMTESDTVKAVATNAVSISNYMFMPMAITVKVGDTVTWTNQDAVHHNVVADNKSSDAPNGPLIGDGETYSFKFTKAGTYNFHCDPHPYMKGTVIVTE